MVNPIIDPQSHYKSPFLVNISLRHWVYHSGGPGRRRNPWESETAHHPCSSTVTGWIVEDVQVSINEGTPIAG